MKLIKNYKLQIKNYCQGQSLFELVIAIGISALVMVVLVSLVGLSLQNAAFAKNETLAGRHAEEAIEWLRGQRDIGTEAFITNVDSYTYNSPRCLASLSWIDSTRACLGDKVTDSKGESTLFVREMQFSKITNETDPTKTIIEVQVKVSWVDSKGQHAVTSTTNFSDWRQR